MSASIVVRPTDCPPAAALANAPVTHESSEALLTVVVVPSAAFASPSATLTVALLVLNEAFVVVS